MQRAITLLVFLSLSAAPAAAQTGSVDRPIDDAPEPAVRYYKRTLLDFTEVKLKGRLKGPEATYLRVRKKTRFRSLIELRSSFAPELERSVDAL